MSLAPLVAEQLALESRQSNLELRINMLSQRQQVMMNKAGNVMNDYLRKIQQKTDNETLNNATENVNAFNTDEFYAEYEIASNRIQAQDKLIEMQKKNIESQQKAVTTALETLEKRIKKNVEKEFNTSLG